MRILLIAPKCYPVSGAESIVNIKMLQAFGQQEGITVDIISKRIRNANYPSDNIDLHTLPIEEVDVIEVDNSVNITTIWQHFICLLKFGVCSKGCHWAYPALKEAIKKIKRNNYDYVLTKSGPSELVGYYLKKHFGMKWVATWNDPYPISLGPVPYGKGIAAKRTWIERKMIQIMKCADIHIFPSERLRSYMLQYLDIDYSNTRIIPHALIENRSVVRKSNHDCLKMIHSGNLGYPRNARPFLEGLRMFLDENQNAKITFTILGNPSPQLDQDINSLNLSENVTYMKPVEYNESLSVLSDYDVAVIIEANCHEGIYLPTKVSDFLQEKIPIFSVSPQQGTLRDLYKTNAIPYFAPITEPTMISQQIKILWKDFVNNCIGSNSLPPKEYYPEYICQTYKELANG